MKVRRVALYQDAQDRLYLSPEGRDITWGEWLFGNNQLFRADGWAIGCGEEYSEAVQVTLPSDALPVASYFPEHDKMQIHLELKGHALDYIFGAKE